MDPIERLSITLPPALARLVREKVAKGDYASNSEVIRAALRYWQELEKERKSRRDSIRALLDDAISDPRPRRTPEQVKRRIDRLHEQSTKARSRAR